jgi:hypothetical protein
MSKLARMTASDIRVGDRERTAVADRLPAHAAAGRLTVEELEERVGRAHAAKTTAELAPLTADLPERETRAWRPPARRIPLALIAAALLATLALSLAVGHPVPPLFLIPLFLIARARLS